MKRLACLLFLIIGASVSIVAQTSESKDGIKNNQQSAAPPAGKQDELTDDVLRVETTLINIPVAVMDRDGKFITDLRREDFRVYEDGVEQQLAFFAPVEQPFTVVLLLDTSPSTRFRLKDIQDAAISFLDKLRPDDRAVGVTFNSELHVLNRMLRDREGLRKAIRGIKSAPGTYLYATVDVMLNKLFRKIPGRKALVIFTDGVDNLFIPPNDTARRRATFKSNLRDAEESGVLIYPIQYNTLGQMLRMPGYEPDQLLKDYKVASDYLSGLASRTGGVLYYADDPLALTRAFTSIAEDLRRQYSLGYYPKKSSNAGRERKIKVSVNRENVVVKARESYTSGPADGVRQ
ncbi:MAG TPA: VWA domain-containing protein [Pyrinomonadaceae bacterium]